MVKMEQRRHQFEPNSEMEVRVALVLDAFQQAFNARL